MGFILTFFCFFETFYLTNGFIVCYNNSSDGILWCSYYFIPCYLNYFIFIGLFMNKSLFVAGLDFGITDEDLKNIFAEHGEVESAKVITDRMTGRSRGFGFVDMANGDAAMTCINKLNNTNVSGRVITVKIKEENPPRNSSGGGNNRRSY